jgi:acyl-CoA dehydrogenase
VDFAIDPDHELIREGVRAVCAGFDDRYWRHHDEHHEFPWDFYRAMAEGGWIGIAIPEKYGGGGRGITEASIVLEEVAASGAAMNGCSAIHLSIFGMEPVVRHGSDEMRETYLHRRHDVVARRSATTGSGHPADRQGRPQRRRLV